MINNHSCLSQADCAELYSCVNEMCVHKNFFPPTFSELIGMTLISVFSGFASLAGIGGGGIMVTFLTTFFNYSQKEALLGVFLPIFGAALGNFLNLITQQDPQTKQPVVNIRSAIIACPGMIMGSMLGLIINKLLPAFMLVGILEYFLYFSLIKFYKTAKKEWTIENKRQESQEIELQLVKVEQQENLKSNQTIKQNVDVIIATAIIIFTVLFFFFLRGSSNINSLIGITYCGFFYWILTLGLMGILYYYFLQVFERFQKQEKKDEQTKQQCFIDSIKAGIINGFGLGGGMFLIPMYLGMGFTTLQSTGTSSFNVLLSSFQVASQVVILGYMEKAQALSLFLLTVLGCYCTSSFVFQQLKKRDRLSVIMWCLCCFVMQAQISLALNFYFKWAKNGHKVSDLFQFQNVC